MKKNISEERKQVFTTVVELTDAFCETYLDEDYRELCREMAVLLHAEGLLAKGGRPASWASGIVHAIGWVNFLQDPSLSPYMTSAQVAEGFGVSQGTMMAKSRIIRNKLDIIALDPDWCIPAMLEDNPLVWMLEVNGFVIDIRAAPRPAQEEAYRLGLIPYIPADGQEPGPESDADAKIVKFPSGQNKTSGPIPARKPKDEEHSFLEGSQQ
jgi:hypothetical protein